VRLLLSSHDNRFRRRLQPHPGLSSLTRHPDRFGPTARKHFFRAFVFLRPPTNQRLFAPLERNVAERLGFGTTRT